MKLEDTGITSLDLGLDPPQPGVSICQFEEGIEKKTNEKSGKTTLRLPMIIDRVVEGPEDNEGKKLSHFCPIETPFGERQVASILMITGLIGIFVKQFGPEVNVQDDKFINGLKLKLPGKFVKVHHNIRKDNKDKDQTNIFKMEKADGKGAAPAKAASKAKAEAAPESQAAGEEWN